MTRVIAAVAIIALVSAGAFAGAVRDGSFSARSDASGVLVRWMSDDESFVAHFELERQTGINGQFFLAMQFPCKGNNSVYEFLDEASYRPTEGVYKYRIKVVFTNGIAPVYYGPITVSHSPSSVRRTWGSIKAMFR